MDAIEQLARLLAIRAGVNPNAEREPHGLADLKLQSLGQALPLLWMDYVAEAMAALATLPANDTRSSSYRQAPADVRDRQRSVRMGRD